MFWQRIRCQNIRVFLNMLITYRISEILTDLVFLFLCCAAGKVNSFLREYITVPVLAKTLPEAKGCST